MYCPYYRSTSSSGVREPVLVRRRLEGERRGLLELLRWGVQLLRGSRTMPLTPQEEEKSSHCELDVPR
jgi:hypothetical protein